MHALVSMPVAAIVLTWAVALVSRRLPPDIAVRALRVAVAAGAAAVLIPLLGSALGWVAGHPLVLEWARFDTRSETWIDGLVGPIALAALAVAGLRTARWHRRERELVALLPAPVDAAVSLVVDDRPLAAATPVGGGHIIVSTGLWNRLDELGRRAVLAHERAHLELRHSRVLRLAGAATAAVPLLVPVRRALAHAVERQADEAAVSAVGDRRAVARALMVAALAGTPDGLASAPAIAAGPTERRVHALLHAPSQSGRLLPAVAAILAIGTAIAAAAQAVLLGTFALHLTAYAPLG